MVVVVGRSCLSFDLTPPLTSLRVSFARFAALSVLRSIMALVNVTNIVVLDNPTSFTNPFTFEVTFECLQELQDGKSKARGGQKGMHEAKTRKA